MNPTDPKWLEILKASGWQTFALALACVIVLFLVIKQVIPITESPLWIAIPSIGAVVFGLLSLASIGSALVEFYNPGESYRLWRWRRNKTKEIRAFIPYMTDKDKEIIAYLLYYNQKMFQTHQDAGYAAPLLSKGIIRMSAFPGQHIDSTRVPFEIPDFIWSELKKHTDDFPYTPPKEGESKLYPWAIHWMAR